MTNVLIIATLYHREQKLSGKSDQSTIKEDRVELFDVAQNWKEGLKQLMLKTFLSFEAQEKLKT